MDKLFKFFGFVIVAAVVIFIGKYFIQGMVQGFEELSNSATSSSVSESQSMAGNSNNNNDYSIGNIGPLSDSELIELSNSEEQSGVVRGILRRMTLYAAKYGIPLINNSERDKLNTYLTDLLLNEQEVADKTYYLYIDKEFLNGKYFITSKTSGSSAVYVGDVDSEGRPHGYGISSYIYAMDKNSSNPEYLTIYDYFGRFEHGRKNGYGIQMNCGGYFNCLDRLTGYIEGKILDDGIEEYSEEYYSKKHEMQKDVINNYLNIPVYEGEFKNNAMSGNGNYSNPYWECTLFDVDSDDSTIGIVNSEMCWKLYEKQDILFEVAEIYVGEYKDNKPIKAKCYTDGVLVNDCNWNDFGDPKS